MGSQPIPELPTLTPSEHRWEVSKENPRLVRRRGIGSEAIVGLEWQNRKGQYDLYIAATLQVADSTSTALSLEYLKEKFELALLEARFQHPECASTASWDDHFAAIIEYESPGSDEAALAWARERVHIRAAPIDGHRLRDEIEERRVATSDTTPAMAVEIFLLANVPTEDAQIPPGSPVEVLVHMNHLYWDGISSRMFFGDLLQHLTFYVGSPVGQAAPKLSWGREVGNLCPPILDSLKLNVETLGADFDAKCKEYTAALMENYGSRGLKFKPGVGVPRIEMLTLSAEDSTAIISGVKTRLGPNFTISHLTQASIILAMFDMLKPTDLSDSESFVSPMPVNGRRWLREDVADKFYAICETGAAIKVDNVKSMLASHRDDKQAQVEALEKMSKAVKSSLDRWLENPYQEALGIRVLTMEANFLHGNHMPFNAEAIPFFISDGINERFIPREVTSHATGETFLTVQKFNFLVNQLFPYLGVRLESWRDASTLAILYNDANYTQEEVQVFLRLIVDFMLAFKG